MDTKQGKTDTTLLVFNRYFYSQEDTEQNECGKPEKILFCISGSKCGNPQVWSPMVHSMRIVGGAEATYGSHPWLVSGLPFFFEHFVVVI